MSKYAVAIFAEKPSQAKSYADAFKVKEQTKSYIELEPCETFPNGAIITWGIGFLVELYMPQDYTEDWKKWNLNNLPIIPSQYKFKVKNQGQFKVAREICEASKCIINACDIDRAGSNIFNSFIERAGIKNKEIKRLWTNSLTEKAVRSAFNNLHDNEKDLLMYEEDKTRQIADWLVGINGSQLYTLLLQKKGIEGTYSVGRVQTVLTYLIYQRDKEIEQFVSTPFFELQSDFEHQNGKYTGKAKIKEDKKETVEQILRDKGLDSNQTQQGVITSTEKEVKHTKPPKLHSLSTLQSKINKQYKIKPAKILEILQKLYLNKLVSYPRTDCNYITEAEFEYLSKDIDKYKSLLNVDFEADTEPKKRFVDTSKVQEHYALIPTNLIPSKQKLEELSEDEQKVYYEILSTTLAMFHEDYVYEETKITTSIEKIDFFTSGKMEISKGWHDLFPKNKKKGDSKEKETLPDIKEDDKVNANLSIIEGKTTPPKPYREGQLIDLMKNPTASITDEEDSEMLKEVEGIGTEATRSGIIETIKQKEYIKIEKNNVHITEKGKIISEAVEGTLLSSASMTAKWETYLKKIGEGNGSQEHFLQNIQKFLHAIIDQANEKIGNMDDRIQKYNDSRGIADCPSCQSRIEDKGKFYGCSGYKNGCKVSFPKKLAGKNISTKMVQDICSKYETSKLKGFKSKKGKTFDASLKLDENFKMTFNFNK